MSGITVSLRNEGDESASAAAADRIARVQVTLSRVWWRIVRYEGSSLSFRRFASRKDTGPGFPGSRLRRGDYSIDAHLKRGTARVIFEGWLEELIEQFPRRAGRLPDLLRDKPPTPWDDSTVIHAFQYQSEGGWITFDGDPRPFSVDDVSQLLKERDALQMRLAKYRGLAVGIAILATVLGVLAAMLLGSPGN